MKVLIVGGSGTIGLGLTKESVARGYETYVLSRGNFNNRIPEECHVITADCRNQMIMEEVLKDLEFDVVVGGLVFTLPQLKADIKLYAGRCRHYVFVSTAGVYHRDGTDRALTEEDGYGCKEWQYNRNKIECEKYLKKNADNLPFAYTIIRPTVTYGDYRIPFTVINRKNQYDLIRRIRDGKPIVACDNVKMAIAHLDDFSNGTVSLFMNEKAYGNAYHIADDEVSRWEDVISAIETYCGKKADILHLPADQLLNLDYRQYVELRYNKSISLVLSNEKIRSVLPEFRTKVSLLEGVVRACHSLEKEDRGEDEAWSLYIDALIYLGVKNKVFTEGEELIAHNYLLRCDEKRIKEYIEERKSERFQNDYDIMLRWNDLKQRGKTLAEYVRSRNYQKIAIYGMGDVGVLLYRELTAEKVSVAYGIDRVGCLQDIDLEIFAPGSELPEADVVVVTVSHSFAEIEIQLRDSVTCPLVRLSDMVYEINYGIEKHS